VQFGISLMNSFGQPVPDITVTVRLTLSDGSTRNLTCVSVASGWCGAWVTLPKALTPSSGVITAMSGACLDSYTIPPPVRWSGGLMAWPTTTTAPPTTSTTTTSTTSTSTTAPPTTTPATTTTRRGPNG
jgi:hypothetical protein